MSTYLRDIAFVNVGANNVATAQLKLGRTYERLILELGGTTFTKAMITDIQIKVNGKLFWRATGTRLDLMNTYRGLAANAAYLAIDFTEQDFKTIEAMLLGTFACTQEAGVQSATIEVTIAGATAPTLALIQQCGEPSANDIVTRMIWNQIGITAAGTFPVYVPYGRAQGGQVKRVWMFHGGNCTGLQIKRNNFELFNLTDTQNRFMQTEKRKVPQTNLMVYDPVMSNLGSDMLNARGTDQGAGVVNSLDFLVTASAADTINMYVEYIDSLSRV
ncbi:major capsid protein P2 [Lacisediminimonas profundi]|uniref:major capsid protein P2 n=1 Tax=Lacisediminimonas profundi TaxID=2603856 RepID=UPI00124B2D4C|nr:major capsid protein P2 [Lacisediminimonas profundi]